jgi:putative endonuclease
MYYTYVLQSMKDTNFYTGFTENLKLRFEQHNNARVESTRDRRPLKLIYYEVYPVKSESYLTGACLHKDDAIKREKYLKTFHGKMFLKKRLKSYLAG